MLERRARDGWNELPSGKSGGIVESALAIAREPMSLLLPVCGGIYIVLGDRQEVFMLLGFVVFAMVLTLVQERKMERALEALRDLVSPRHPRWRASARRRPRARSRRPRRARRRRSRSSGPRERADGIQRMVKQAAEHEAEDKARREQIERRNHLDSLCYTLEKRIRDNRETHECESNWSGRIAASSRPSASTRTSAT